MTEYYVHLTHREQLLHITRLSKMTRLSLFFHQDHILTVKEKQMPKSEKGPFKTPTVIIGYYP